MGRLSLTFVLLSLALVAVASRSAQARDNDIGAYFSLVNTYLYTQGPQSGKRYLIRPRNAFRVIDLDSDNQERLWFLVIYPQQSRKVSGVGWTPKPPHELVFTKGEPVRIYSRIPSDGQSDFSALVVPPTGVELLNESQTAPIFQQVVWQKVRYRFEMPVRAWAREGAGIFRPGKTNVFMTRVYGEMVTRGVPKAEQVRLLSGVVRIGDGVQNVRWALGEPLRSQEETVGDAKRTIWQYRELKVEFENEVVKQLN